MGRDLTRTALTIAVLALMAATAAGLYAMGRSPMCACGYVALWNGDVNSAGNSQHIADPYSFSHVTHGVLFYGLAWLIGWLRGTPLPFGWGVLMAVGLECAWELAENTPAVIARYRAETVSLGYDGDSIVNSISDILAMLIGYAAAATLPVALVVAAAILAEVALAWLIRDNLVLNVLMLLHPIEAIKAWQAGR